MYNNIDSSKPKRVSMKIGLVDSNFPHNKMGFSSMCHVPLNNFEWDRQCLVNKVVFTDASTQLASNSEFDNKEKYAWLIEPREINPSFNFVKENEHLFNGVFTHEPDKFKNGKMVILGGCWIYKKDQKCYFKTDKISIVASNKNYLDGHKFRHTFISKAKEKGIDLDVFGGPYRSLDYKLDSLKDYKYQVVIENVRRDNWFTEKLIDCFATGTIPIYWGCPNIGDYFDERGIIAANSLEEIIRITNEISIGIIGKYNVDKSIILENLVASRYYNCAENQIFERIKL